MENQRVICFLFVDNMLLVDFSYAFCGGNWVARVGISDHRVNVLGNVT